MDWKPASDAPRDGRTLLFATRKGDELGFMHWTRNKWKKQDCFTSIDEEQNFSIPIWDLQSWVFIEQEPPT